MEKKIIRFDFEPDYCFSDSELGSTVLVWPETVPGMDMCFRCREKSESGEIVDYRVFGYDIPANGQEYQEIIDNINSGDLYALEWL